MTTIARLMQGLLHARVLIVAGILAATVAAAWWLQQERLVFVTKCWKNGNGLTACNCTFNALGELPSNYRSLATSWAHDSSTAFAGSVIRLVAAETLRIGSVHFTQIMTIGDREKSTRRWILQIAKKMGWGALRKVAPKAAPVIVAADVAVDIAADAIDEAAKAQGIMDRHCGTPGSLIVQINDTRKAAMEFADTLSAKVVDTAVDTGIAAAEAGGNAASGLWSWMKSWVWAGD